ncbi:hypothetical protein B0H19DRAFT_942704, partial [Mycena capillaripes]
MTSDYGRLNTSKQLATASRHVSSSLSVTMNSRDGIPDEIWLEVFRSFPRDTYSTLKDLSLTLPAFRRLLQPLLFANFDFHPYALDVDGGFLLPSTEQVEESLARLNFWCSDEIIPLIRSCRI